MMVGEEMVTNDVHPVYKPQNDEITIEQPAYEAFDLDIIKQHVRAGIVLQSQKDSYTILRPMTGSLFGVQSENHDAKFVMKIYDTDEVHKYQNEVEKLGLLVQIMEDMGIHQESFLVEAIDSFSCEVSHSGGLQALCIVMEHLEMSVSEFLN